MRWLMMVAVLSVATLVVGFAAVTRAEEEPLKQDPTGEEISPKPSPEDARIQALVKDLGSDDYDVRETAYRELERLGGAARSALERAARSEDVQTRVSAGRLLRKLEDRPAPGLQRSPGRARERWLEDWERRLRERGLPGFDGDLEAWRRKIEERLEAMRKNLEGLERDLERDVREGLSRGSGGIERHVVVKTDEESIDCRVDADGKVRVEISRTEDGKPETRIYEAESVEAFEKAHPEAWEKVKGFLGAGGRLRIEIGPHRWPDVLRPPFPLPDPDEGPRLGILVGDISPALRSHLGLAPEEGLLVEEVMPDSRAERLGMRRYDVLLSVGGTSVADPEDVREALSELEKDAAARVTVVRRGKRLELVETR